MSKVTTYNVGHIELMHMPLSEVLNIDTPLVNITFPEGVYTTTRMRVVHNWVCWEMFRQNPDTAPNIECVLPNKMYKSRSAIDLIQTCFWVCEDQLTAMGRDRANKFWNNSELAYNIANNLYNFVITHLSSYRTTLSMRDIHEVLTHPVILDIKSKLHSREISIDEAYNTAMDLFQSDDLALRSNAIRQGVSSGIFDKRSIAQTFIARGYVKDIDGVSFPYPIDVSYSEGLQSLYDQAIESSSAKRALMMQGKPLEDSEYNNRRTQLSVQVLRGLKGKNCNTKYYEHLYIEDEDDLKFIVGMHHLSSDGELVITTLAHTHLIGTTVSLRSPTTCDNHDTTTVCATCLGHFSKIVPPRENIGHYFTVGILAKISQLMLSTKHVEVSQEANTLNITAQAARLIKHNRGNKWLTEFKKPQLRNAYYAIKFKADQARNLSHVKSVVSVNELTPTRISSITEFAIELRDKQDKVAYFVELNAKVGGRGSSLSLDALQYCRDNWDEAITVDKDNVITLHLTNWDYTRPFLISPRRNKDIMQLLKSVETYLNASSETRSNDNNDRSAIVDAKSTIAAIMELRDILSPPKTEEFKDSVRVDVNFIEIAMLVRQAMVVDPENNDWRIPRAGQPFIFRRLDDNIQNRSKSGLFAFEGQKKLLKHPSTYITKYVPPHLYDPLITGKDFDKDDKS